MKRPLMGCYDCLSQGYTLAFRYTRKKPSFYSGIIEQEEHAKAYESRKRALSPTVPMAGFVPFFENNFPGLFQDSTEYIFPGLPNAQ